MWVRIHCTDMTAKQETAANGGTSSGVTIAAEAFDPGRESQVLHGTKHILIDGEPLCGNPHVKSHVESGSYGTETTQYPVNEYGTCKSCAQSYVTNYGSEDELFEKTLEFEEGDWVSVTTENGETMTGRVSRTADRSEFPSRRLSLVLSDEPQERWLFPVDTKAKLRVREGEQPTISMGDATEDTPETGVTDFTQIAAPEDNIDDRTEATLDDLREITGNRSESVMVLGRDPYGFHINTDESLSTMEVWELLDDLHNSGYEIAGITKGENRSGTDCTAISVFATSLKSPQTIKNE